MNKAADDFPIGPRLRRLRIAARPVAARARAPRGRLQRHHLDDRGRPGQSLGVGACGRCSRALDVGVADFFAEAEAPAEQVVYRARRTHRDRRRRRLLPPGRSEPQGPGVADDPRALQARRAVGGEDALPPGRGGGPRHQGPCSASKWTGAATSSRPATPIVFDSRKPHAFRNIGAERPGRRLGLHAADVLAPAERLVRPAAGLRRTSCRSRR